MSDLLEILTSSDTAIQNRSLDSVCQGLNTSELLSECDQLDHFRRTEDNLYRQVRALFFLTAIHRFHLPPTLDHRQCGNIPYEGYEQLLGRRFPEAVDTFLNHMETHGPSIAISSGLAEAYHQLAFQTLANQVRRSVRTVKGNQWMFRTGHPFDLPLKIRPELLSVHPESGCYPNLKELTAVRMDFTHSAWSDIFFLGMDYPDGAKVINASINLAVRGRHSQPEPPIECSFRVIDEPVLRLVSIDLDSRADLTEINEVFDFGRDYLGLLKAAVIASGLVPPGMEGCGAKMSELLNQVVGPGLGLEIVSRVNDIPKGSRLAVSTNLLGSLISICMRATGQVSALEGSLAENDRRIVAARAILGEWIGGSGGGWQDSGGIWPGIKLIQGATATSDDPEFGISTGRLMPQHSVFTEDQVSDETRQQLQQSLVLVHGGMAQNVGPILEMVTEKYLLRSETEWVARQQAIGILDDITAALKSGDIPAVGEATHRNFHGPLQDIIPWCTTAYTERLIQECESKYGDQFHGFWMLGGMSGGGMGFIFDPAVREQAAEWLQQMMLDVKHEMQDRVAFAMDPVVYDFEINDNGTFAELCNGLDLPAGYFPLIVPKLLKHNISTLPVMCRKLLEHVGTECRSGNQSQATAIGLLNRILPGMAAESETATSLEDLLKQNGFSRNAHEQIKEDMKSGRLGLAQNRLPATSKIEDVCADDVIDATSTVDEAAVQAGALAIKNSEVAVVTLAAGVGSRWTQGAGVVKALNPFWKCDGEFRSFLDLHLAKTSKTSQQYSATIPHLITTGYLTDEPIRKAVGQHSPNVFVSRGASVGLRMVPLVRDLQFAWEETSQQVLDEQQEKVRSSVRAALIQWAKSSGEASDYTDNIAEQCLHPVGHWYEVPNLLLNGTLQRLLQQQPCLKYLMLHNIDTLGANVDPANLGLHIQSNADLSFEVIGRRLDDRGGGLAKVDGKVRLVEGLAMPREEEEFDLSYYNTLTTWITIDRLLAMFELSRADLADTEKVAAAVDQLSRRLPTYVTLKDVKKRWGRGQEDVFPICQFEKLWGDMTALADVKCQFQVVPIQRGQQMKDPAQLDAWLRDGSAQHVASLATW